MRCRHLKSIGGTSQPRALSRETARTLLDWRQRSRDGGGRRATRAGGSLIPRRNRPPIGPLRTAEIRPSRSTFISINAPRGSFVAEKARGSSPLGTTSAVGFQAATLNWDDAALSLGNCRPLRIGRLKRRISSLFCHDPRVPPPNRNRHAPFDASQRQIAERAPSMHPTSQRMHPRKIDGRNLDAPHAAEPPVIGIGRRGDTTPGWPSHLPITRFCAKRAFPWRPIAVLRNNRHSHAL